MTEEDEGEYEQEEEEQEEEAGGDELGGADGEGGQDDEEERDVGEGGVVKSLVSPGYDRAVAASAVATVLPPILTRSGPWMMPSACSPYSN